MTRPALRLVQTGPDPLAIPPAPRRPHVGDAAYGSHSGYYLGPVSAIAPDGATVTVMERSGIAGETRRFPRERPARWLTFCEPVPTQAARLSRTT